MLSLMSPLVKAIPSVKAKAAKEFRDEIQLFFCQFHLIDLFLSVRDSAQTKYNMSHPSDSVPESNPSDIKLSKFPKVRQKQGNI